MAAVRHARSNKGESAGGLTLEAPDQGPAATAAERLDYIAEIVLELKAMAEQANCRTLSGLLDLAYCEAKLRQRSGGP